MYHARPGFTQAVAALQANRVHVVPYTNGRVFDPSSPVSKPKWEADGASRYTCNHYRGGPLTEKYEAAANFSFAVMDPASQYWQSTVADVARDVVFRHNVSGVYIDETASAYAQLCWHGNRSDGRVVSAGGAAWAHGNRALLQATVEAVGPNRAVISESNAEACESYRERSSNI